MDSTNAMLMAPCKL